MVWFKTRRSPKDRREQVLRLRRSVNRFRSAVIRAWELQDRASHSSGAESLEVAELITAEHREAIDAWNAILVDSDQLSEETQMRLRALADLAAADRMNANLERRTTAMTRFTKKLLEQLDRET